MLSLLFRGWVWVLAGAEAPPKADVELPSLEPGAELLLPASDAELALPASGAELALPEFAAELPLHESAAELSAFEPGLGWMLLQTFIVLAGVVLLAYILLNVFGKYLLKLRDTGSRRAIFIVERVSVDARKSLLLVKAGSEYFLLSSGERALTVLSKLNTEDVEKALSNAPPAAEPGLFLKKLLERKTTKKPLNEGES